MNEKLAMLKIADNILKELDEIEEVNAIHADTPSVRREEVVKIYDKTEEINEPLFDELRGKSPVYNEIVSFGIDDSIVSTGNDVKKSLMDTLQNDGFKPNNVMVDDNILHSNINVYVDAKVIDVDSVIKSLEKNDIVINDSVEGPEVTMSFSPDINGPAKAQVFMDQQKELAAKVSVNKEEFSM